MKISVVIPNYNGAGLLQKNLPKVLNNNADEIIVVDDFSSDNSKQVIQSFPSIKLIQNKKNLGFVKSVNKGVERAKGDIIVLLNNDVESSRDFLKPVLPYFKNDKVFAVSFAEPQFSWAKATFADGFIVHNPGPRQNKPHVSFWASGGSAAFSRKKWQKLGGMDEIYHPFYWEDIDLSYRAQKLGWEIWWEPASIVYHAHGGTIEKYFSKNYVGYISARNRLIFIWKNVTDKKMFTEHKNALLKQLLAGKMWKPFFGAFFKLPEILEKRKREKFESKVSDAEIFEKFTD